jgi:hypothetical protein
MLKSWLMASHLEISPAAETATLRNSGTAGMAVLAVRTLRSWGGLRFGLENCPPCCSFERGAKRRDYRPWDLTSDAAAYFDASTVTLLEQ